MLSILQQVNTVGTTSSKVAAALLFQLNQLPESEMGDCVYDSASVFSSTASGRGSALEAVGTIRTHTNTTPSIR